MDYAVLKAELARPAYAGLSDADAAAALNARSEPGPVPALDAKRYLRLVGRMAEIERVARFGDADQAKVRAALALAGALNDFAEFDLQAPPVAPGLPSARQAVERDLDLCVEKGLLAAEDKAAILELENGRRSPCERLGLPPVNAGHVAYARSLNDGQ